MESLCYINKNRVAPSQTFNCYTFIENAHSLEPWWTAISIRKLAIGQSGLNDAKW